MAGKTTRAISREEFEKIISTIRTGFVLPSGHRIRPNERIATALVLEANLGMRIGDILNLKLKDIVLENGRYRLDVVEQKSRKHRTFTVPTDIYIYLQNYALANNLSPQHRLFPIDVRTVQNHLQHTCEYLGIKGCSTHSFRKMFAQQIYNDNDYNIGLVRTLLQHSSAAITQHYIGIAPKQVEEALQKHIILPT